MQWLLRPLWALPWPGRLRKLALAVMTLPGVRLVLFPHFMVGVVGVIRDDEDRVLLLRHTYRSEHPWGLPTGFLEHGEQPNAALVREIEEETGFSVSLSSQPGVYTSAGHPILNVVYVGRYLGGDFSPGPEISAAQFFRLDDLPPLQAEQRAMVLGRTKEAAD